MAFCLTIRDAVCPILLVFFNLVLLVLFLFLGLGVKDEVAVFLRLFFLGFFRGFTDGVPEDFLGPIALA